MVNVYDEYGNLLPGTDPTRYGWLGGKQRSSETPSGAMLMGIRLYDSTTGRFLSADPIPSGNATAYEYCAADPTGCTDLTGAFRVSWWSPWWSPVYYVSMKFNKRETRDMAIGAGAVGGLLAIAKDYLPKSYKHVIAAIRTISWYLVVVSGYAAARGKCTKVAAGAIRATVLSTWNAWAVKC
ncbi:RHS repeat-associated core domain-containing protein [Streptomyces sp. NPDC102395]|uniref:RHS repeat-associated core domain-containing protein n=1 Tax=Streptomyces sp. NPDC102395 TaxID=3366168 RepID=UPI0037FD1618